MINKVVLSLSAIFIGAFIFTTSAFAGAKIINAVDHNISKQQNIVEVHGFRSRGFRGRSFRGRGFRGRRFFRGRGFRNRGFRGHHFFRGHGFRGHRYHHRGFGKFHFH